MKNKRGSLIHTYHAGVAEETSIIEAIILESLAFWVKKNEANRRNYYDGRYWTYNSVKAYAELFPEMSEKQIGAALKKLESRGLIVTGNYNKLAFDHTKWYALTEEAYELLDLTPPPSPAENAQVDSISQFGEIESPTVGNRIPVAGDTLPNLRKSVPPTEESNTSRVTSKVTTEEYPDKYPDACYAREGTGTVGVESSPSSAPVPDHSVDAKNTDVTKTASTKPRSNAIPSIEDVERYVEAEGLAVDPREFYEACERRGWKNPDGQPINSWKGYLRGWARNGGKAYGFVSKTTAATDDFSPYHHTKIPEHPTVEFVMEYYHAPTPEFAQEMIDEGLV